MLQNQYEYELNLDPGYAARWLDGFDKVEKQHTAETRTRYVLQDVVRVYFEVYIFGLLTFARILLPGDVQHY